MAKDAPAILKAPIPFRGFDEKGDVRIYYHGILPHWRQSGCSYFVTFRLHDSIPEPVMRELEYERTLWLKARDIDPKDREWKHLLASLPMGERRQYEQLVGRLLNRSLDECHGACVLRNSTVAQIVATALDYFHGIRVLTGDFVIMPNHVHVLMTPMKGHELEDILHSIKSYTSNKINKLRGETGQLWQRDSYDHIIRDPEQLQKYQEYVTVNPLKAKLNDCEYILSSARYTILDS